MSVFALEADSENYLSESNIQQLSPPKLLNKDLSAIYSNSSGDCSFQLSSPVGEYKLNNIASCGNLDSLNDSSSNPLEANISVVEEETNNAAPEETTEERIAREERESQELAWRLMQEDNMEVYNMQMQFMQENADQISEEDMALIESMIRESGQPQMVAAPIVADVQDDQEEEGYDELNESNSSNWDYERLLQLGQQIGGESLSDPKFAGKYIVIYILSFALPTDVKTERWRMRAKSVINSLPRKLYSELMPKPVAASAAPVATTVFRCQSPATTVERDEQSSSNKKQCIRAEDCGSCAAATSAQEVQTERCVVCMDDFEAQEELVVFPCRHYFHIPCTEGWLAVSLFLSVAMM